MKLFVVNKIFKLVVSPSAYLKLCTAPTHLNIARLSETAALLFVVARATEMPVDHEVARLLFVNKITV